MLSRKLIPMSVESGEMHCCSINGNAAFGNLRRSSPFLTSVLSRERRSITSLGTPDSKCDTS